MPLLDWSNLCNLSPYTQFTYNLCRLNSKKSEIARVKEEFRSQREETLLEIERLQDALKVLEEEEARKVAELEQEVDLLSIFNFKCSSFRSCSLAVS